ncbi:glycosyl hydrolase 108 family protein [Methylobacterium sp. ARG-1]|uniref:glycoside hydrolase family 108 protein n=1 Tax=Methylobacterium sp. ARG-1 TaxID=1692501 RepID=UPI000AB8B764|nr:glycosyl hydrolase 108 family protein [Methylobacterium sp. ARG-1]
MLVHEGGCVDNPADPGGATNLGVTIGTLSNWLGRPATGSEVKALAKAAVAPIYRQSYWNAVHGDELPPGGDYYVFDFAVNSGKGRVIPSLQRALSVADDGKLGPLTLAGILQGCRPAHRADLCRSSRLPAAASTWPTFGKDWTSRVEGVRAEAMALAAFAAPTVSVEMKPLPSPVFAPAPRNSGSPAAQATPPAPAKSSFFGRILANLRTNLPPEKRS